MALIRPILSEKTAASMDNGLYVFAVDQDATKSALKTELKKIFDVDAVSIRIVNLPAKKVSFKRRPGVQTRRRKAYIQLAAKQRIPGYELPKQKEEKNEKK